jgi:Rrf2 family protein
MLRKKTATYALLALYEIAHQQRVTPNQPGVRAGDIAQRHKLPKAYAAKILSQMAGAGVLHSDRGPRGGFKLARPIEEISLYDVFESVGAVVGGKNRGPFIKGLPPNLQDTMSRAYGEAANALKDVFMKVHLTEMIEA